MSVRGGGTLYHTIWEPSTTTRSVLNWCSGTTHMLLMNPPPLSLSLSLFEPPPPTPSHSIKTAYRCGSHHAKEDVAAVVVLQQHALHGVHGEALLSTVHSVAAHPFHVNRHVPAVRETWVERVWWCDWLWGQTMFPSIFLAA